MFVDAYPIPSGSGNDEDQALKLFILDYGAPDSMIMDGSKPQPSRSSVFMV